MKPFFRYTKTPPVLKVSPNKKYALQVYGIMIRTWFKTWKWRFTTGKVFELVNAPSSFPAIGNITKQSPTNELFLDIDNNLIYEYALAMNVTLGKMPGEEGALFPD